MNGDFKALAEELKRHIDVSAESVRSDVRSVAEGVIAVHQRLDDFRSEVNRRFDDTHAVVKSSVAACGSDRDARIQN